LLGDCQTIGGYPKIAHVITVDLPIAAQLWPGDPVRFFEVSLEDAQELLRRRELDFARFRVGIKMRLE
jgi:antagonist of KipI